jgi:hypothetical protein
MDLGLIVNCDSKREYSRFLGRWGGLTGKYKYVKFHVALKTKQKDNYDIEIVGNGVATYNWNRGTQPRKTHSQGTRRPERFYG